MALLTFASRRRRTSKVSVFDIQGSRFAFPLGTVVAHAPWSGCVTRAASNNLATSYTSFLGELIPVFDVRRTLGLSDSSAGGDEVLILETGDGFAAIQIDRFLGNEIAETSAQVLLAEEVLPVAA